jgi:hypothetical protein
MSVRVLKSAAIAALAFGFSSAAGAAAIFNFSFTAPWLLSSAAASASGQLYANELGDGSYQVFDVAGTSRVTNAASVSTLDNVSAIGLTTPIITGSATAGYTINAIQLSGGDTYNLTRNLFSQTYTVTNGLRTSSEGALTLALVPPTSPVPEVATWVMMVIGFGAAGMILRSGKRRGTASRT